MLQALADEDWINASMGTISNGVFTAKNEAIGATLTITNAAYSYKDGLYHLKMSNQDATTTITFTFTNKNYSIKKFWCNAYYKKKKKFLWSTTTVSERVYPAGKDGDQFSRSETDGSVSYRCTGKFDNIFLNSVYLNYNVDEEVAANPPVGVRKQYNGNDQVLFKGTDESAYSYSTYTNSSLKLKCGGTIYFWFEGTGLTSDKGLAKDKGSYTMQWKYNVGSYSGYTFDSFVYSKGGGIMYLKSNKFNQLQGTFSSEIYGLEMTDVTAPTAKELVYTGEPQALVTAASSANGKGMYLAVGDAGWSDAVPTRTNAGTYKVYWYVQSANSSYADYGGMGDNDRKGPVTITISEADIPAYTPPVGLILSYNAEDQRLINAATATGGTAWYRLKAGDEWKTEWTSDINDIKLSQVGTYTIYYYFKGDVNHKPKGSEDSPVGTVQAQIIKADYNMNGVKWGGDATVTYNGTDYSNHDYPNALKIDASTLPGADITVSSYTYTRNGSPVTSIVDAGTYTVTAHFSTPENSNYQTPADMSTTLTVAPFNLKDAVVTANIPAQTYTSEEVRPVTADNTVLRLTAGGAMIPASAYTAAYLNHVNVGTATATLSANGTDGNYIGSTTLDFTITKKPVQVQTYNQTIEYGSSLSNDLSKASLLDACTGHTLSAVTLKEDDDMTLQIGDNEHAIMAVIAETFIKDASGNDVTANYTITCPTDLRGTLSLTAKVGSGFTVLGLKDEYEGDGVTAVKPAGVSVYDGTTLLTKGMDYDVAYTDEYNNATNIKAGEATVTFKMKGYYTGTISKHFTIYYSTTTYSRLSVPAYNYCTYYHPTEKLQAKGDAKVYYCTLTDDKKDVLLVKENSGIINAGVPVMLRTPAETTTVKLYAYSGADATYTGTNALTGVSTTGSIDSNDKIYIFDGESFVWATGGNYTKNRAYINGGTSGHSLSAPRLSLVIAGENTTGIHGVEAVSDNMDGVWYDLQGRRLDGKPSSKGLYILNGRKVVVK